jgi:hypothetical protein
MLGCQHAHEHEIGASARPTTASAATVAEPSADDRLRSIDQRQSVPLLPAMANHQKQNMRDHLNAVQAIIAGLAIGDFPAIEQASHRLGFSEQTGQMCTHMGLGAPGFSEQAIEFHQTADRIAASAVKGDAEGVTRDLAATLALCTGCHARWKQQVVDEKMWSQLTGVQATSRAHGHTNMPL